MKIFAIIGEIGDPIARPFFCSYTLPLNWKYVVVKQNSSSLIMSDGDMVVRSGKDSSNRRRDSASLITSLTGLVNSDSASKETMISFLVRRRSLIDWTKLAEMMM